MEIADLLVPRGVIAQLRADSTWRSLYDKWLGRIPGSNPTLPQAEYDG